MSKNNPISGARKIHSKNSDKPKSGFPIDIVAYPNTVLDPQLGGYTQWVVAANGLVIAHFVDETSCHSYLKYLETFGFNKFPKKIIEILENQARTIDLKKIG